MAGPERQEHLTRPVEVGPWEGTPPLSLCLSSWVPFVPSFRHPTHAAQRGRRSSSGLDLPSAQELIAGRPFPVPPPVLPPLTLLTVDFAGMITREYSGQKPRTEIVSSQKRLGWRRGAAPKPTLRFLRLLLPRNRNRGGGE